MRRPPSSPEEGGDVGEQGDGVGVDEVADRGAGEVDDGAAAGELELLRERGGERVKSAQTGWTGSCGKAAAIASAEVQQEVARDVDGDVGRGGAQVVEEQAGLGAAAAEPSSTNATPRPHTVAISAAWGGRSPARCGSGSTRGGADLLEEPGAEVVVEVLAGQGLVGGGRGRRGRRLAGSRRRAGRGRGAGRCGVCAGGGQVRDAHVHLARRMPENCQRASGGRSCGSWRACGARGGTGAAAQDDLVAHELAVVLAEGAGGRAKPG
jgi:hypothetical protein